jgi:hypothetical protein
MEQQPAGHHRHGRSVIVNDVLPSLRENDPSTSKDRINYYMHSWYETEGSKKEGEQRSESLEHAVRTTPTRPESTTIPIRFFFKVCLR